MILRCKICAQHFSAQRNTKQYCSVRCRRAAERQRYKITPTPGMIFADHDFLDLIALAVRNELLVPIPVIATVSNIQIAEKYKEKISWTQSPENPAVYFLFNNNPL